jgi:hypothetical protein
MLLTNNGNHKIGTHVLFDLVCTAHWVRPVTYSHSTGKAEAELKALTLRWLLRGEVLPDRQDPTRFAVRIRIDIKDRSSSENSNGLSIIRFDEIKFGHHKPYSIA